MGTWGPGNFDNDTAADHLSTFTARLRDEIAEAIAGGPTQIAADEYDGVAVPCNVELLALVAEQQWTGTVLPDPATVRSWKHTYLTIWDDSIDELAPAAAWKKERRAVLARSFDRLARASERLHGASSPTSPTERKRVARRARQRPKKTAAGSRKT